jgi:hypothetical protein
MTPAGSATRLAPALSADLGWRCLDARRSERDLQAAIARATDRREHTVVDSVPLAVDRRAASVNGHGSVRYVLTSARLTAESPSRWSDEDMVLTVSGDPDPASAVQAIRREFGV